MTKREVKALFRQPRWRHYRQEPTEYESYHAQEQLQSEARHQANQAFAAATVIVRRKAV